MTTTMYKVGSKYMTEDQMHAEQTPEEVYQDCIDRMTPTPNSGINARLRRRCPNLASCNAAMSAAYAMMTSDQRSDNAKDADTVLSWQS